MKFEGHYNKSEVQDLIDISERKLGKQFNRELRNLREWLAQLDNTSKIMQRKIKKMEGLGK